MHAECSFDIVRAIANYWSVVTPGECVNIVVSKMIRLFQRTCCSVGHFVRLASTVKRSSSCGTSDNERFAVVIRNLSG